MKSDRGMEYDRETYDELRKGRKFDKFALDNAWVEQSNLFYHASEGQTLAIALRDRAEHEMKVAVARIELEVRDQMVADGEKLTEATVKAKIRTDPEYGSVHVAYIRACEEANRWISLVNTMRQRADALKGLTALHNAGYYGERSGVAERSEAVRRTADRARE